MAKDLDAQVEAFRRRRLDQGPYTFVAADALVLKVREAGRVARVHALVATEVNADGYREVLGITVTSSEDGAGWLLLFRDLVDRGLSGVQLVTADADAGLVAAIGATLPRRVLATVPDPLLGEPDGADPEDIMARGAGPAALASMTSPTRKLLMPTTTGCWKPSPRSCRRSPRTWRTPART